MEHFFIPFVIIIFILGLGTLGSVIFLLVESHETSISAMIAQRHRRSSYLMIICISMLSMLVSTMSMASVVVRQKEGKRNESYLIYCAIFSPIASALILIFPLVVFKSTRQLQYIPHNLPPATTPLYECVVEANDGTTYPIVDQVNQLTHGVRLQLDPLPYDQSFQVSGVINPTTNALMYDQYIPPVGGFPSTFRIQKTLPISLFIKSENWARVWHYLCIGLGVILACINLFGYVSWKFHKNEPISSNTVSIIVLTLTLLGVMMLIIFAIMSFFQQSPRLQTLLEAVGLLLIYAAMLTISITAGDFD